MVNKSISIILALMFILYPVISCATSQTDLNNQRNEIQENIDQAEEQKGDLEEKVSKTQEEINQLNYEISVKEDEIDKITGELNSLNSELESLTNQLNEAQEKYDKQYEILSNRIVAQYKKGTVSYLEMLIDSKNLVDFISNYYIIGKIAEYDTQLLEDIETQKATIQASKTQVEQKQKEVQEKEAQLKIEQITLTNHKSNKNKYMAQLSEEERQVQETIDSLNEDLRKVENEIRELARQSSANGGGSTFVYDGGTFFWPCPNYKYISSYFGYRGSAATGGVGTANHNGYDLAAPHYSDIFAAEDGVVIKVVRACSHDYPKTYKTKCNCGGGYGNYVMIQHGGGLVTVYGHCASIDVNVGDTVTAGQRIGAVGSAGWSTGYHLHFSVILNGTYVNPGPYLGK